MIPTMKTLLSLSLAGALAGCSLAPKYERPEAPIDAVYPAVRPMARLSSRPPGKWRPPTWAGVTSSAIRSCSASWN